MMIRRLVDARKRVGMSQEKAAEFFGVSRQWLSLLEVGSSPIPKSMNAKVVDMEAMPIPEMPEKQRKSLVRRVDALMTLLNDEEKKNIMDKLNNTKGE